MTKYKIVAVYDFLSVISEVSFLLINWARLYSNIFQMYQEFNASSSSYIPGYLTLGISVLLILANLFIGVKLLILSKPSSFYFWLGILAPVIVFISVWAISALGVLVPFFDLVNKNQ